MLIASLITTAALTGIVYAIHRDQVRFHRAARQDRATLDRVIRRINCAQILPDREGRFRLMVPISFDGGMADGETQFVPILHDEPVLHVHRINSDGISEQTYQLHDQDNGTVAARPLSQS